MAMHTFPFFLSLAAGLLASVFFLTPALGVKIIPYDSDLEHLLTALLPTVESDLLNFFRIQAKCKPSQGLLSQLNEPLHNPQSEACQHACAKLVAIAKSALPLLHKATCNANATAADL